MPLDLATLMSQPLVAFTIELDNEYAHRTAHRTTLQRGVGGRNRGPWLTSFAMYANCLQFLGEGPMSVRDLERSARSSTNLDGMRRWGYIKLSPPPDRPNSKRPNEGWLIELTPAGRMSQESWRPVPEVIEQRWRDRFGTDEVSSLRAVLMEVNLGLDLAYPDFMPILKYGLFTRGRGPRAERPMPPATDAQLRADSPLTALLSRPLCAFAYEFERHSPLSLAISANLLPALAQPGIRNRDLPQQTGVSKESIAMAMGILKKAGLVEIESGAGKTVRLTALGLAAQRDALQLLAQVENRWVDHFGKPTIQRLREVLERLVHRSHGSYPLLLQALKPYPGTWRASLPEATTLPRFPMVLHRGGHPDGS
jgi:DNA-binding MarR family transcriptional regulator